jgi:hypothetical protein
MAGRYNGIGARRDTEVAAGSDRQILERVKWRKLRESSWRRPC